MHTTQTHTTSTVRSARTGGDLAIAAERAHFDAEDTDLAARRFQGWQRRQAVSA